MWGYPVFRAPTMRS
jgi:hypothetical protein